MGSPKRRSRSEGESGYFLGLNYVQLTAYTPTDTVAHPGNASVLVTNLSEIWDSVSSVRHIL